MRFVKNRHWLLITVGTLVWSLTMVKSSWRYDYGLGFWGPNGHDGVWHVALAGGVARGSWEMPIFAGEKIKNYHLGFDLALAGLHTITRIPMINLYFQLLPPILAILIGGLTYKLTQNNWSVFFVYFGGSFGWLLGKGESTFWSQQAISTLINPPFALSLIMLLVGLLLLQKQKYILAGLIFAILPHIKIYAGLLAFIGLLLAGFRNRNLFKTLGLGLLIYLPSNYELITNNSSLIVWQPGWFLETMMSYSDRVGWTRFYSAMTNYRLGGEWVKAILAYGAALVIFMVGNLGTRVAGMWRIGKNGWMGMFMWSVIGGGIIIPMLFLQKGTPWNTIQFLYYSLFFSGILAGVSIAEILKIEKLKNYLKIGIWVLVISLTLPTTWQTLQYYLPSRPPAMLPTAELMALQVLAQQPKGAVLTYPFDPAAAKAAELNPPRPLYLYESTAYVAAFSQQPVYLEDEVNLNITSYDWRSRRQAALDFFAGHDAAAAAGFLRQNHIAYIYLPDVTRFRPQLGEEQLGAKTIYGDGRVAIWQISK